MREDNDLSPFESLLAMLHSDQESLNDQLANCLLPDDFLTFISIKHST
jgi:hypothetical protein